MSNLHKGKDYWIILGPALRQPCQITGDLQRCDATASSQAHPMHIRRDPLHKDPSRRNIKSLALAREKTQLKSVHSACSTNQNLKTSCALTKKHHRRWQKTCQIMFQPEQPNPTLPTVQEKSLSLAARASSIARSACFAALSVGWPKASYKSFSRTKMTSRAP